MVATAGGQPQVVTFALDALLARGEPVAEVVVIHPAPGEARLQRALGVLSAEFAHGLYHSRPCRLQRQVIRHGDVPLATIHDDGTAEATWQTVYAVIGHLKQAGVRLHLCVTGGPRMIGLLAMSAAALHFDHQDRLWHLYTPREVREAARDGAIMHVDPGAGVRLVPVAAADAGQLRGGDRPAHAGVGCHGAGLLPGGDRPVDRSAAGGAAVVGGGAGAAGSGRAAGGDAEDGGWAQECHPG